MKFTSVMSLFSSVFVAASTLVAANPLVVNLAARDVFVPPVLEPTSSTVWIVGQQAEVTWDTSNHPVNITNSIGRIMLRKSGLATPVILASNFSILDGQVNVTVPWVIDGNDYQIVLFGDSGNFSPDFSIVSQ